jgi:CheY-like chemotaxis protein
LLADVKLEDQVNILVIDDEPHLRSLVRRMLESAGHTVTEAANGRLGIEAFDAQEFQAVVTDLLMPVQEGIETIRKLRARSKDVRIIAISGGSRRLGNLNLLEMAKGLGADAAVEKPFRKRDILKAVERR